MKSLLYFTLILLLTAVATETKAQSGISKLPVVGKCNLVEQGTVSISALRADTIEAKKFINVWVTITKDSVVAFGDAYADNIFLAAGLAKIDKATKTITTKESSEIFPFFKSGCVREIVINKFVAQ